MNVAENKKKIGYNVEVPSIKSTGLKCDTSTFIGYNDIIISPATSALRTHDNKY